MNEQCSPVPSAEGVESKPRAPSPHGGEGVSAITEVLRHLISRERDNLFSDAILARTTAMLSSLGRQLAHGYAEASEAEEFDATTKLHEDDLTSVLADDSTLLAHCHALAVESVLADRLHTQAAIDPALPPLVSNLLGSEDDELAGAAMHVVAAQSRFLHAARRMDVSLREFPPELFVKALDVLASMPFVAEDEGAAAKDALSASYDDTSRRLSQIARLHLLLQDGEQEPTALDAAGLAIFAYGLAERTGEPREHVVLTLAENDPARLSDLLRAADWPLGEAQHVLALLHPQGTLPADDSSDMAS